MKKKLSSHDDTPSTPLPPKTIEVGQVNNEGNVREAKYSVDENYTPDKSGTQSVVKNEKNPDYWLPADEIDIYAVDTRIWDRIGEMGGGGDGGGPHTHDTYATKTELSDGLAGKSDDPHTHNYADATHTHPEYEGGSGESYDDTELRGLIQDNTDALDDKSDTDHTHPPQDLTHNHDNEYAPIHNHPYASDNHTHPEYEGGGSGGSLIVGTWWGWAAPPSPNDTTSNTGASGALALDTDPTGSYYLNIGWNHTASSRGRCVLVCKTSNNAFVSFMESEEWLSDGSGVSKFVDTGGKPSSGQWNYAVSQFETGNADDLDHINSLRPGWNVDQAIHLKGTPLWLYYSPVMAKTYTGHFPTLDQTRTTRQSVATFSQDAWDEYLRELEDGEDE